MDRRKFLTLGSGVAALGVTVPEGLGRSMSLTNAKASGSIGQDGEEVTAGSASADSPFQSAPIISGPSHQSLTILQPLNHHATGYLEYSQAGAAFQRVDASQSGLLPFQPNVLKFVLPELQPGVEVRFRVIARSVAWVRVGRFEHGKIVTGEWFRSPEFTFRTLDPTAAQTRFCVWNDTHENQDTLNSLLNVTEQRRPDFLLWNGDQSNDVHDTRQMSAQFLAPDGLSVAQHWPLAYVRGNHDVRGPAARQLDAFTGTPNDRYYYAFRSGPVAALVMDTGEDKADDHPNFGGLAAFTQLRQQQAQWLEEVATWKWFQEAPFKVLFCHLPLWWVRDRKDIDWWEFSKESRDLWLPGLVKLGVRVVISGHTHEAQWMPASEQQPIGQLTGGGPRPNAATILFGQADQQTMRLSLNRLDGTVVQDLQFNA